MKCKELLCRMYASLSKTPGLEKNKAIYLTPAGFVSGTSQNPGGDPGSKSKVIFDLFKEARPDLIENEEVLSLIHLKDVLIVSIDLKTVTHMDEFLLLPDQVIGVSSGNLSDSIQQTSQG
ncbi:hypothetical protein L2W58_03525 [Dethiosulfovibrio sp. F2B]|uniref:hypothetical protein n=1 Tax=Dethiosulfovibrio faecalis TaxID=2720018 RepID=UPI001F1F5CBA|nr:hypothetical protein [Dethiosulfovibrio faecalis]MCF4150861.1 hypothetical protein [Dethiosulfovibrio faecalis]